MNRFNKEMKNFAASMTDGERYQTEKAAFLEQISGEKVILKKRKIGTWRLAAVAVMLCAAVGISTVAAPMLRDMQYVPGVGFVHNESGTYEIYVTEEELLLGEISFDRFMRVTVNGQSTLLGWSYSMVQYDINDRISYTLHRDEVYQYNNRILAMTENSSYPMEIFEYAPESYVLFAVKEFEQTDSFKLNLDGDEKQVNLIDINESDYADLSDMEFPSDSGITLRIAPLPGSNTLFAVDAQPYGFAELTEMAKLINVNTCTDTIVRAENGGMLEITGGASSGAVYYGSNALPFKNQKGWSGVMLTHMKNPNDEQIDSIVVDKVWIEFSLEPTNQPRVSLPVVTEGEGVSFEPVEIFSADGISVTVDQVKPIMTSDHEELIYFYGSVKNHTGFTLENAVLSFGLENVEYSSTWYGIDTCEDGSLGYFVAFEKDVLEGLDTVDAFARSIHFVIDGDWAIEY